MTATNPASNGSNQNIYMAPLNDYGALFKIDLNFKYFLVYNKQNTLQKLKI